MIDMKVKLVLICMAIFLLQLCHAQNKNVMPERYDFELVKKIKEEGRSNFIKKRGDTIIYISGMTESGAFYDEYPPAPNMYFIQKQFYPSGEPKSIKKYIGRYVPIGETTLYDEQGNITKVDEDAKFGKIKPDHILKFLEKEGWIDLKTGRGREEIAFSRSGEGYIKQGIFELFFIKKGEAPSGENDYPIWSILITEQLPTSCCEERETTYRIHGETGEVLKKTVEEIERPI